VTPVGATESLANEGMRAGEGAGEGVSVSCGAGAS